MERRLMRLGVIHASATMANRKLKMAEACIDMSLHWAERAREYLRDSEAWSDLALGTAKGGTRGAP